MSTGDNTQPPKRPEVPDEDQDRTLIAPMPVAEPAPAAEPEPEDADRTIIGGVAPAAPLQSESAASVDDGDRTIIGGIGGEPQTPGPSTSSESGSGSTYRPFSSDDVAQPEPQPSPTATAAVAAVASVAPPPSTTAPDLENDDGLEATQLTTGGVTGTEAKEPISNLEPGAVINNMYRVEERLDQGGMGRVYRGVEIGTGESVAIKVILPEMAEDIRVAQMFRREARTLRQLHHDAIVRYFAYVPPDANMNLHVLVMGFIEGNKLSDKLKNDGPLSPDDVCTLFTRLADGLERAHKIGVVHRDLSPDNVMLADNDINKAIIIDFGISRSSKIKDVTIGNEFAGKLKYVSPEQLGAYGGEAEGPSDVYSLGLLIIACLQGKAVNMGDSIVEAVQKRQGVPDLNAMPVAFQALLHNMLQPDPTQRLQSMTQVIDGLKAISGDEPTATSAGLYQRTIGATNRTVAGLQAAPTARQESFVTSVPAATSPGDGTDDSPAVVEKSGGGFGIVTALVLIAAVAGGGGWYYMNSTAADGDGDASGEDQGLARVEGSRETYLAEAVPEGCTYAARRGQGPNTGMIEGFAEDPTTLTGVGEGWSQQFGTNPAVVDRLVGQSQCAALEFARTFQGTSGGAIEMALDQSTVSRADGVVGTIHGSAGRENWLALVAPNGRVFSLMSQLGDPIGEQRTFSFRLPSAQPGTYVLIATASDEALVRAAAMQDGTAASEILPLMTRELADDGLGAVDIGVVEITR
ncbi:MAG: serine/threonine-protein kinase [Pseudomonadota bacterium]